MDGFTRQPWVMNGASELLVKLFGDKGQHARSAIGTNQLPLDIPVEVEMIVQVTGLGRAAERGRQAQGPRDPCRL